MLILVSKTSDLTDNRVGTNKPELRHRLIRDKLLKNPNYKIHVSNSSLDDGWLQHLDVHDENMIDFLQNCYSSFEEGGQGDSNFKGAEEKGLIPYNIRKKTYNHNPLFELEYFRQMGFWADDALTPIFKDSWANAFNSAYNSFMAHAFINEPKVAKVASLEPVEPYNTIYCLNSQPGHHASYSSYGGYCFLNNAAIVAKSLLQKNKEKGSNGIKRVAILDIDYHAGNGTSQIFEDNSARNVLTVSIHANPALDYPFYSGYECENTETNINIIFNKGIEIKEYLLLLEKALNAIEQFGADCLVIAFGGDTFKNDPDASPTCRCSLGVQDYFTIGKTIKERFTGKKVITQEGGYDMENIDNIVFSFLEGFA